VDLVRPPAIILVRRRREPHVDHRLEHRLAVVQRLEARQLVLVFQDELAQAPDRFAALSRAHLSPFVRLERLARAPHGTIDVRLTGGGDRRDHLFRRGVDHLVRASTLGVALLAVDEQPRRQRLRRHARRHGHRP
jgi:hypothetical protein